VRRGCHWPRPSGDEHSGAVVLSAGCRDRATRTEAPAAQPVWRAKCCRGRCASVLRPLYIRRLSACCQIRRSHPQGRQARRSPRRAADEVRVGHQPQDRQGPRPDDPAVGAGAGGSGDRVMDRRAFISTLAGGLLAAPLAAQAQPRPRTARVAFLEAGSMGSELWQVTREGLRELGYVEGQNLIIEFRSAEGQVERLPALLAELIRLRVDVIVVAGDAVVVAAKQATSTIPIVMAAVSDPVGREFVASLARPGGNVTGTSNLALALTAKWLE